MLYEGKVNGKRQEILYMRDAWDETFRGTRETVSPYTYMSSPIIQLCSIP